MASGYYTARFRRRKPIAAAGYVVTALGPAAFGLASDKRVKEAPQPAVFRQR